MGGGGAVCRLWREALEGSCDDGDEEEESVWRAVALRLLPCWHAGGEEEEEGAGRSSNDGDHQQQSIEERKRQLWGRPAAVAPDVPPHRWKQTLRCTHPYAAVCVSCVWNHA
jgi:hypothetical protein